MTKTYKREENPCPHCWRVLYSKGALTSHVYREHWEPFKCPDCGAPTEDEDGAVECRDCLFDSQLRALGA